MQNEMHSSRRIYVISKDQTEARTLQHFGFRFDYFLTSTNFLSQSTTAVPGCVIVNHGAITDDSAERFFDFVSQRSYLPVILIGRTEGLCKKCVERQVFARIDRAYDTENFIDLVKRGLDFAESSWARSCSSNTYERLYATLSPREREVYGILLQGAETKQIGLMLGISCSTAEKHRLSIIRKMNVRNHVQLVLQKFVSTGTIGENPLSYDFMQTDFVSPIPRPKQLA